MMSWEVQLHGRMLTPHKVSIILPELKMSFLLIERKISLNYLLSDVACMGACGGHGHVNYCSQIFSLCSSVKALFFPNVVTLEYFRSISAPYVISFIKIHLFCLQTCPKKDSFNSYV